MIYRHNNEGGLFDIDIIEKSNTKIKNRELLPNEVVIDVAGKTKNEVFTEAIKTIENFKPEINYNYKLDDEKKYYSWVKSKKL